MKLIKIEELSNKLNILADFLLIVLVKKLIQEKQEVLKLLLMILKQIKQR